MTFWDQFQEINPVKSQLQPQKTQVATTEEEPKIETMPKQDYWSQFEEVKPISQVKPVVQEESEKSFGRKVIETGQKYASRALETVLGLPGDIEAFARPYFGVGQTEVEKKTIGEIPQKRILPTSEELRQLTKETFKGKLEPEGEVERIGGELLQDYIFQPGGPLKKIALAGTGKVVEEGLKLFGASEDEQSKAKMAASFFGSLYGKKNVKDYYKKEYGIATRAIPVKETIDAGRLTKGLGALKNRLTRGLEPESKKIAMDQVDKLLSKVEGGKISVRSLDDAFHDINEIKFSKKLSPKESMWLDRTKNMVRSELRNYGKVNPEYFQAFSNANAAYAGFAQNQKAVNTMNKWGKAVAVKGGLPALAAELYLFGPVATAETAAAVAAGYGLGSGYDLMRRVVSNKTLFHYYTKTLAAAAQENLPQITHNLTKLDKKLREMNPETSRFMDIAATVKRPIGFRNQ